MAEEDQNAEHRVIYETPQGCIVRHPNGNEDSFRVLQSRTPGLVFIHLQINKKNGRRFYQTMEVDASMARVLAMKMTAVADALEGADDE